MAWHEETLGNLTKTLGKRPELCSKEELLRYLVAVGDRSSSGNAENRFRSLRTFFRFAHAEGLVEVNPMAGIPRPRPERKVIRPVSADEMKKLLRACRENKRGGRRDEAVLMLFYDAGLRAGEVATLRREDVDITAGVVIVRGKGAKERRVPIGFKTARAITRHLESVSVHRPTGLLVETTQHRSFTHRTLGDMIQRVCRRAGVRHLNPHLFRHSAAIAFLRNGGGPFHLQRLLGHSDLAMTRRYCALVDDDVMEAHRQFGPGDRL